jgi:hypothetical protein
MSGLRARIHLPEAEGSRSNLKLKFKLKSVPELERVTVTARVAGGASARETLEAGRVHTMGVPFDSSPRSGEQSVWLELEADGSAAKPQLRLQTLTCEEEPRRGVPAPTPDS